MTGVMMSVETIRVALGRLQDDPENEAAWNELAEAVTWAQLGIHDKPIGILNVSGYFDSLLAFVGVAVESGFVDGANRGLVRAHTEVAALLAALGCA